MGTFPTSIEQERRTARAVIDWLGAEARVHVPARSLSAPRLHRWSRTVAPAVFLISFALGLAIGRSFPVPR